MECKKCGAAAPEGAIYCPHCGNRVDGKRICHSCGATNEESYKYCVRCGVRIDGKNACENCGAEYEGEFCPQCGTKRTTKKAKADKKKVHKGRYAKVMHIVSVSLGLAAALAAFVFMFFVGFGEEKTVFYYFSDALKDLKELKIFDGYYYSGAIKSVSYFAVITSFIIALATVAGVTVLFVLTAVRGVKALCGKATHSPIKTALWTVFCYALGVAMLCPIEGGEIIGEVFKMNGGTVAGLILTSVFLGGAVVCGKLADLKQFKSRAFNARWICLVSSILVGSVAFFMLRNAGMKATVTVWVEPFVAEGAPANVSAFLLGLFSQIYSAATQLKFEVNMLSLFGILGEVTTIAAVAFLATSIFKNVSACAGEKGKVSILYAALAFGLSIGTLIFSLLIGNQAKLIVNTTEHLTGSDVFFRAKYVSSILAMVFAFVNLGVAIAARIVSKRYEQTQAE